mgnify:FL=1
MSETNLLKLNINDKNFSKIRDIRKNVFTDELGILESELFDEYDEICDHFIIFDGKNVVGAVRFVTVKQDIKLERMAILKEFRTKNHGKDCISQLREYYHTKNYSKIP